MKIRNAISSPLKGIIAGMLMILVLLITSGDNNEILNDTLGTKAVVFVIYMLSVMVERTSAERERLMINNQENKRKKVRLPVAEVWFGYFLSYAAVSIIVNEDIFAGSATFIFCNLFVPDIIVVILTTVLSAWVTAMVEAILNKAF